MLNFSDDFKTGLTKITKIWLNFTLADGTRLDCAEDRVSFNGFTRDTSTSSGGEFTVGSAVTGEIRCSLNNSGHALSKYDFRDATVIAWLGGYKASSELHDIHPDNEIVADTRFTITGLTPAQLALFEVGGVLAFGTSDHARDIGILEIVSVSTSNNITTIEVGDIISAPSDAYISILVEEKVNVGRYYVDEYKYNGAMINIVAYDDMCKFDVPCRDTNIMWPSAGKTIADLVADALSVTSDLSLWNASLNTPSNYIIEKRPEKWDTMTCHDIIAYCAQLMCCFAHIVYVPNPGIYQLKFDWYDTAQLTANQYDGGTFDTDTVPYSDGATLNGGDFTYTTVDTVDGGTFGDRTNVHIISSPHSLTVDTDDVLITGVQVVLEPSDNIAADDDTQTYITPLDPDGTTPPVKGSAGYVITISNNAFIETVAQAETIAAFIYSFIGGMRFRPLSASVIEDPSMEAGDVAVITGRNANVYACFLSHVTYTTNNSTQISCDAASTMQNLKARFSESQETRALIQRVYERTVSNVETAMNNVLGSYAASMGLYPYTESDGHGGTIYTYGNKNTLAASDIRWRFAAGALTVSNDYGQTWTAGLSADGVAVLNRLYAVGIESQILTVTNGQNVIFNANANTGIVNIGGFNVAYNAIYSGKTSLDSNDNGVFISPSGFSVGDFKIYPSVSSEAHSTPSGTVEMGNAKLEYEWLFGTDPSSLWLSNINDLVINAGSLDIYLNSNSELLTSASFYLNIDDSTFFTMSDNDVTIRSENGDGEINLYGNLTLFGDFVHVEPV